MILLVGGNGFIGRHVRALLCESGHEVAIVSRRAAKEGTHDGNIRHLTADELYGEAGHRLLRRSTAVVYLASTSVPSTFASAPWKEIPENVETAARFFFECSHVNPDAKIVLISSGGTIYGRVVGTATEDCTPAPISGYGLGKLMIEEALRFTARTCRTPYTILRVSNPVGRFQVSQSQGIIPIALRALRDQTPFDIFGDGSHVRDYVDADDVARAIQAACLDRAHNEHTWNVGSGSGRSILEIVDLVERVTKQRLEVRHHPARPVDVPFIVLDSTRIREAIGWKPTRPIDDTCYEVWEWVKAEDEASTTECRSALTYANTDAVVGFRKR